MKISSALECAEYLYEMKEHLSAFTDFGIERFTGIILGRFFSVTYHSGHEFNRRITNEKHRAIGFVRPCENGTQVYCIRLAGMTNPLSLIAIYTLFTVLVLLKEGAQLAFSPVLLAVNALLTAIVALGTAFADSVTERGQEGSKVLTAFLINPVDFYSLVGKL